MSIPQRLLSAGVAGVTHLGLSALVALAAAGLIFRFWYPWPYSELVGGRELFLILVSVDVVCGPLLTMVLYDPRKARRLLFLDISLVVALQLGALAYGISTLVEARPAFLAFEGNRFRVVRVPDIPAAELERAPEGLRRLPLDGPGLIAARLSRSGDPDYLQSLHLSLQGFHPSFRPERWEEYDAHRKDVIAVAKPLSLLRQKYPEQAAVIEDGLKRTGVPEELSGFLPLVTEAHTDWVVVIRLADGQPVFFLHLDGW